MPESSFTDAIALLKADHRTVEDLFDRFEKARSDSKRAIAEQICNELKIHAQIEEEIFYPALEGKIEDDLINEAIVEHDGAKILINDIMGNDMSDEDLEAKVKVLSEEIEHHVGEEEKRSDGMFAQARDADVDLVELRDRLEAMKADLQARLESEGLPPAQLRVVKV
jgi:hemerythrin superfamily protein